VNYKQDGGLRVSKPMALYNNLIARYNFLVLDTAWEVGSMPAAQIKIISAIRKKDTFGLIIKINQPQKAAHPSCFFYACLFTTLLLGHPIR
jgi:hypothetical protein